MHVQASLCAGQVPLTDAEAQALKDSRQTSASQDWLMGADPIEHETTACQDSGQSLLSAIPCFHKLHLVLPEPHLMASPDMLCLTTTYIIIILVQSCSPYL